jgi:hypothetical protein
MCKYGNNPHLNRLPKDLILHIAKLYLLPRHLVEHPTCGHRLVKNQDHVWVHDIRIAPPNCVFENQWFPNCHEDQIPTFK